MTKTAQLIDNLITGKDKDVARGILAIGERNGDLDTACQIVGNRFGMRPEAIEEWYMELQGRRADGMPI